MWKRYKLFRKHCACKNETQKKLIHEEFKKLRNNVTFSIRKSKNEYFKLFLDKNHNNTILNMERNSAAYYNKIQKQSSSKHCQSKR